MPMKRYTKPIPQTTLSISEEAYEFIEGHKTRRAEPKYQVLDRIIGEYEQLKERIAEQQVIIDDLRDTTTRQWNKLRAIENISPV